MFKLKSKIKYLLGALIAFMFKINFSAAQPEFNGTSNFSMAYGPPPYSASDLIPSALSVIGLIGLIIGVVIYIKSKKK